MTADSGLRVALIGYGLSGEVFHASLIAATEGIDVTAVVTADPDRRARVTRRFPHAELLSSPDAIWADPSRFDLVVISSPNRTHIPLAMRAVGAGLPVVVEKPVAATVVEAEALKDAAAARGVPVAVFQNRRWDGDFLTLAGLLDEGRLGSVHRFESRFERWRPEVSKAWKESPDPADAGGVFYDLGSHLIDQALVLFGPVDSVYAELRNVRPGARVDDDAFVALAHRNGTVSHLWASLVAADVGPRVRALGSAGAFVKLGLDGQEALLRARLADGSADARSTPDREWAQLDVGGESRSIPIVEGRYARFYELLAVALVDGGPVPVGIDDAIATLRVIEAAQASDHQRDVIDL
ncbi:MAG: oxidoreductase domain protein [Actinomycetia bacterium]|nr:oxidoreductase domain protein [Actinomycetes bacterium]